MDYSNNTTYSWYYNCACNLVINAWGFEWKLRKWNSWLCKNTFNDFLSFYTNKWGEGTGFLCFFPILH